MFHFLQKFKLSIYNSFLTVSDITNPTSAMPEKVDVVKFWTDVERNLISRGMIQGIYFTAIINISEYCKKCCAQLKHKQLVNPSTCIFSPMF